MTHKLENTGIQSKKSNRPVRVDSDSIDSKWMANHIPEPVGANKRTLQFAWMNWERPAAVPSPLNEI